MYDASPIATAVVADPLESAVHAGLEKDLKEWFTCDPETGSVRWNKSLGKGVAGREAGALGLNGRVYVRLKGISFLKHRLIWWFDKGTWPTQQIDHINGCPSDNRICNLREVTASQNMQNFRKPTSRNTSGFLGVSKKRNRFVAHIRIDKRSHYIGAFATPEEAYEAYLKAKRKHHATCTI